MYYRGVKKTRTLGYQQSTVPQLKISESVSFGRNQTSHYYQTIAAKPKWQGKFLSDFFLFLLLWLSEFLLLVLMWGTWLLQERVLVFLTSLDRRAGKVNESDGSTNSQRKLPLELMLNFTPQVCHL